MPRLVVVRGEALVCQVDLDRLPVTIGRAAGNDVVLDDPLKSVSREHAHIRHEGDRYVLVDQESENGIWLAGQRLRVIPFSADTTASIGPFRLRIDGLPPEPRRTPVPAAAAPAPAPPPATGPRIVEQVRTAIARVTTRQWLTAVTAVTVTFFAAFGIWAWVVQPAQDRARLDALSAEAVATAHAQIAQGQCADALEQTIRPALTRHPDHTGLQDAQRQAESCLTVPPPEPPSPDDPNAMEVIWIRGQLALRICDGPVVSRTDALLQRAPDNPDYRLLKADLEKCRSEAGPKPPSGPKLAVRIPPADGGLEPLDNELDRDYVVRVRAMRQRYDAALTAAKASVSRESVHALESLAADLPAGYLDMDGALRAARTALRAATETLVVEGRTLLGQSRWNDADAKFKEARTLDPELRLDAELKRLQDGKTREGLDACNRAKVLVGYPAQVAEGRRLFRLVTELLPPSHECHVAALAELNRK